MSAKHLVLLLSLGTSACGLYFPGDTGDTDSGVDDTDLLFVAAGDQGALASSPDGVTWTTRTSGTTVTLHDVTHGDGRYVAVGQGGKILVSDDGVAWTGASSPSSRDLFAVEYHVDRFYAVGGDYSAGAETLESMDGTTWTRPELPAPMHLLGDLASDGADLVAIGTSMSDLQIFGLFTWNETTGLPNCWRWWTYFSVSSIAPSAMPSAWAATPGREMSNVFMATRKPMPSRLSRFVAGTRAL